MAFWTTLVTWGPVIVTIVYYVGDKIVGEIIYTESCYVESTGLWPYGYYKNIQFWNKRCSKYDPALGTTAYWS